MLKTTLAAGALALATLFLATLPALALDPVPTSAVPAVASVAPASLSRQSETHSDICAKRKNWRMMSTSPCMTYGGCGSLATSPPANSRIAAVATLLSRYGVSNPTAGNAVGEFTDPVLQKLHDELIAPGQPLGCHGAEDRRGDRGNRYPRLAGAGKRDDPCRYRAGVQQPGGWFRQSHPRLNCQPAAPDRCGLRAPVHG